MDQSNSIKFQLKPGQKRKRPIDNAEFIGDENSNEIEDCEKHFIEGSQSFAKPYTQPVNEKPLLVIPLIEGITKSSEPLLPLPINTEKSTEFKASTTNQAKSESLDELAAREILKDIGDPSGKTESTLVIGAIPSSVNDAERKKPLLLANIAYEMKGLETDEERFKKDILLRADDMDVRSSRYKDVPVEEFGAALLRGMGWTGPTEEDKQFAKKSEEPIIARDGRLGLGATAKPPEDKKHNNPNKAKSKEEWNKKVEDTLKKQTLNVGDIVWLRVAIEAGKRAQVIAVKGVPGLDKIRVRMELDGRVIEVSRLDAVLVFASSLEESPYLTTYKDIIDAPRNVEYKGLSDQPLTNTSAQNKSLPSQSGSKDSSLSTNKPNSSTADNNKKQNWLYPGIRVRIVSKSYNKAYLQKGVVDDVHGASTASVRLDDGTFLDSVKDKHLETVLPSTGGQCRVLRGEYSGQYATLLEKRKDEGNAVVQLSEDYEIKILSMDDIAAVA